MDQFMRDNSIMVLDQARVSGNQVNRQHNMTLIKDSMKVTRKMGTGNTNGPMDLSIRDFLKMT